MLTEKIVVRRIVRRLVAGGWQPIEVEDPGGESTKTLSASKMLEEAFDRDDCRLWFKSGQRECMVYVVFEGPDCTDPLEVIADHHIGPLGDLIDAEIREIEDGVGEGFEDPDIKAASVERAEARLVEAALDRHDLSIRLGELSETDPDPEVRLEYQRTLAAWEHTDRELNAAVAALGCAHAAEIAAVDAMEAFYDANLVRRQAEHEELLDSIEAAAEARE